MSQANIPENKAQVVAAAPSTELRRAAQAVLDRWNSPKWEWHQQGPTADLMADLSRALAPTGGEAEQLQTELTSEQIMDVLERFGRVDFLPFRVPGTSRSEKTQCRIYATQELADAARAIERAVLSHLAAPQSGRTSGEALGTVPSAEDPQTIWRAIGEDAQCMVIGGEKFLLLSEDMCVRLGGALGM